MKMNEWHVIPYLIRGVKLYAVENDFGYIEKYCDTRERAEEVCKELSTSCL